MFSFVPNPTRAKNAWPSSTFLLYGSRDSNIMTKKVGYCLVLLGQIRSFWLALKFWGYSSGEVKTYWRLIFIGVTAEFQQDTQIFDGFSLHVWWNWTGHAWATFIPHPLCVKKSEWRTQISTVFWPGIDEFWLSYSRIQQSQDPVPD